ncbi:MAG: hypothetical protein GY856_44970 [bacterium]|nr:hypothetical protein [bacterium]
MIETRERFNPFPGLRAFEADEDHLFFGRDGQIDEMLSRLGRNRFLAVVGTSGSGKSSLVRSGLIPSLYSGYMTKAGSSWRVAVFRPGYDPIGSLAAALNTPEVLGVEAEAEDAAMQQALLETTLYRSARGLVDCVRQAHLPEHETVLVVADQFEELFRFKHNRKIKDSRDSAMAFVKLLLEAAQQDEVPLYVVLTMRSDFIGNCTEFPGLAEAANDGQFLVPRMTRNERRSAIVGPVAVGGAEMTPRLVLRLLNDVGDDPDQLPTLQHALMRTWDYWEAHHEDGEPIDLRHYESIGTLKEALSLHAEEAYGELTGERGRKICERLFKALTDMGSDSRGVRRPIRLADACELTGASEDEVIAVVERFRLPGRSFLTPAAGIPLDGDSILDISHESLMRIWSRLIQWVEDEARSAQIYLRLSKSAARYQAGSAGLWRDPELQLALNWRQETSPTAVWSQRYDPAFERAMLFLEHSEKERQLEIAEKERQRRRQLQWARALAAVFSIGAVITLLFLVYALVKKTEAEAQRKKAEEYAADAVSQKKIAEQQSRAAVIARNREEDLRRQEEEQRKIAVEERRNAKEQERAALDQKAAAEQAKATAEQARLEEAEARAEAEEQRAEAVDQKRLADVARVDAVKSEAEAQRLRMISLARELAIRSARLQDEHELAALLATQAYQLNRRSEGRSHDPAIYHALHVSLKRLSPDFAPVLRHHRDAVRAVALGPDGYTLASGSDDGTVVLFDLRDPKGAPSVLGDLGNGVRSVAWDPAGERLAAGSFDGSVRLWDRPRSASSSRVLDGHDGSVNALAWQPGGTLLVSGGSDGRVELRNLEDSSTRSVPVPGDSRRVMSVAFGSDGRTLAAAAGSVFVWDVRGFSSEAPQVLDGDRDVQAVAFSGNGRLLAGGTKTGVILLWDLQNLSASPVELPGHASGVNALSFSADRALLASASLDRAVLLWDLDQRTAPIVLEDPTDWVWTVALSADGERVVAGGADRTIQAWNTRTEPLAEEICNRVSRNLTPDEWQEYLSNLPYQETCPR